MKDHSRHFYNQPFYLSMPDDDPEVSTKVAFYKSKYFYNNR
jgi:hypothetical protein